LRKQTSSTISRALVLFDTNPPDYYLYYF
jgi:hypothetical protein